MKKFKKIKPKKQRWTVKKQKTKSKNQSQQIGSSIILISPEYLWEDIFENFELFGGSSTFVKGV